MQQWRQGDPEVVARLERRYELLRGLIIEFRSSLSSRDPKAALLAPPAEVYLAALELETSGKTLEQMVHFVDDELMKPLSNLSKEHPVRVALQRRYVELSQALIPQVVERLHQGIDFDHLLDFMSKQRRRIAEEACDLPTYEFGRWRAVEQGCITRSPFHREGWFEAYLDQLLALVPKGAKEGVFSAAFVHDIGAEWETVFDSVTVWAEIGGRQIPLSVYVVGWQSTGNLKADWLFSETRVAPLAYPAAAIVHTDPSWFPILKKHCLALFDRICRGAESQETLVALLAEFHWYLAHATFFRRGSASISEYLVQALCILNGLQIRWTKQPDLQALLTPRLKDFIHLYSTLMIQTPMVPT